MRLYFQTPTEHDVFVSLCKENNIQQTTDDSKSIITVTLEDNIDNLIFLNNNGYYEID